MKPPHSSRDTGQDFVICVWHDVFTYSSWHGSWDMNERWLERHEPWLERYEPWLDVHGTWLRRMWVAWLVHLQFVTWLLRTSMKRDSRDMSHDSRDTGHDSVMYVWFDLFTYSSWNDYWEHEWNVTREIWAMTRETRDMTHEQYTANRILW